MEVRARGRRTAGAPCLTLLLLLTCFGTAKKRMHRHLCCAPGKQQEGVAKAGGHRIPPPSPAWGPQRVAEMSTVQLHMPHCATCRGALTRREAHSGKPWVRLVGGSYPQSWWSVCTLPNAKTVGSWGATRGPVAVLGGQEGGVPAILLLPTITEGSRWQPKAGEREGTVQ